MKSFACFTIALGAIASASAQVNSVKIYERFYNDDSASNLTTVNNYPSIVSFRDENLDGDGSGTLNRHLFRFSADNGATDFVHTIDTFFDFKMDVALSGTAGSVREGGIIIEGDPTGTAQFIVKSDGEIAAFGGGLPFWQVQPVGSTVPTSITLGIRYFLDTVDNKRKVTYTAGTQTFTAAIGNTENGIVAGRVGGYGQFRISENDPNNFGMISFSNIQYAPVPEPASLAALGLGAAALLRRRRNR